MTVNLDNYDLEYVHQPQFASWYPSDKRECAREIDSLIENCQLSTQVKSAIAGVVPHAGWFFSGPVAAQTFHNLRQLSQPDTLIIFGTVHRMRLNEPCILLGKSWSTPLGPVEFDLELSQAIMERFPSISVSPQAHQTEHSIEVEMPFVKHLFPQSKLVAIMVPPKDSDAALALGKTTAAAVQSIGRSAVFIASTDLSHYGSNFGHMPYGPLPDALEDVHKVDRRFIDLVLEFNSSQLVPEAEENWNACGAGATAATVAAAQEMGAHQAELLQYTTSAEIRPRSGSDSTVGYSAIVLGQQKSGSTFEGHPLKWR